MDCAVAHGGVGVEGEVAGVVVVGVVVGAVAIVDDEDLEEAEEGPGVAVAGVVLVIDDLLHGPARLDAEGLQFDLNSGHAIDEDAEIRFFGVCADEKVRQRSRIYPAALAVGAVGTGGQTECCPGKILPEKAQQTDALILFR